MSELKSAESLREQSEINCSYSFVKVITLKDLCATNTNTRCYVSKSMQHPTIGEVKINT